MQVVDNERPIDLTAFLSVQQRTPEPPPLELTYVALDVSPNVYVLRTLSYGEVDGAGALL